MNKVNKFAVVCDSKHESIGPLVIALVDRSLMPDNWWTAYSRSKIKKFFTLADAEARAKSFKYNNPRVMHYDDARKIVGEQAAALRAYQEK